MLIIDWLIDLILQNKKRGQEFDNLAQTNSRNSVTISSSASDTNCRLRKVLVTSVWSFHALNSNYE